MSVRPWFSRLVLVSAVLAVAAVVVVNAQGQGRAGGVSESLQRLIGDVITLQLPPIKMDGTDAFLPPLPQPSDRKSPLYLC